MSNVSLCTDKAKCPICNSEGYPTIFKRLAYSFKGMSSKVKQCRRCKLWMLTPRYPESEMIKLYQSDGYFHEGNGGYDDYEEQKETLQLTFRDLLTRVKEKSYPGAGLLEIGSGDGLLLDEAKKCFDYTAGMDYSEDSVQKSSQFADEMFLGGLESLPAGYIIKHDIYTVIATNVIEHVYDPVAFVEQIYNELPVGGILVLAAPDMGSLWRKFMFTKWPSFKLPEHIFYYDDKTLEKLMKTTGFRAIDPISCPHYFPVKTLATKLGIPEKYIPNFLKKKPIKLYGIMTAVMGIK